LKCTPSGRTGARPIASAAGFASRDGAAYLDEVLARQGVSRRVALTVPNFLLALAALTDSDLLAAVPKSLVDAHGARFGLASVKPPFPLRRWRLRVVAPRARLADPGVSWLFGEVERAARL
jgi:DNA-binding transcriptional LysR family regulator